MQRLREVEAIGVHHLRPGRDEVLRELLLRIRAGIDFRERAKLGMRAEDQVYARCRSTSVAFVLRSRPSYTSSSFGAGCHCVRMSSRLTKKSLVSRSGRPGEDAMVGAARIRAEDAQAAEEHGHLRPRQVQQLRPVHKGFLGLHELMLLAWMIVAEAVGARLERREGLHVGLLLRRVHAARREGYLDVSSGVLRGLLDRRAAGENDQVGERNLLAARLAEALKSFWIASSFSSTVSSCAGWFTSQSFCGARRMRAPLAPPRLSERRKVEAEAHAVETSCETDSPEARILRLQRGDIVVVDQRMIDRAESGPARSASPSAPAGRGSARPAPCRDG